MAFDPRKGDRIIEALGKARVWLETASPGISGYVSLGFVLFLLFFGSVAVVSLLEGVFFHSPLYKNKVTFIKDIAAPLQFGLLNPLVIVLILKYYDLLTDILTKIDQFTNIVDKDKFIQDVQSLYKNEKIIAVAILVSVCGTLVFFFIRYENDNPYYFLGENLSFAGALTGLWGIFVTYVIAVWVLKSMITNRAFQLAFSNPLKYQLLHHDKRAGLGTIGTLFHYHAGILLVAGITLSLFLVPFILHWREQHQPFNPANFLLGVPYILPYVVLAPLLYAIPLWNIHQKMKEAKGKYLMTLVPTSGQIDIKTITEFYAIEKELPEWPTKRIGFSAMVTTVIGSLVIPLLADFLKTKVGLK